MNPKARKTDLLIQPVGDELVLYDCRTHHAHRLNPVAGVLWRQCDGSRTVEALSSCLHEELGLRAGDTDPVVHGLDELSQAGLLDAGPRLRDQLFDRRAALLAAAVLVPMVTTIVAPTPADAQSLGFPPPPPPTFDKFNGNFAGRSVLIDSGGFQGFSNQLNATAKTDVDDQGVGDLDVSTMARSDYDLSLRAYDVTIQRDGTISGEGSFVTSQGVAVTCSIEGSFNAACNRLRFMEVVVFDNHIGTVTWEIIVSR